MLRAISPFLEDLVTESNSSRSPVGCLVLRKYQQSKMTPVMILKRSGPLPFLIVFEMIQDWRSAIWVTGWVRRLSCSFLFLLSPYGACVCVKPVITYGFLYTSPRIAGGQRGLAKLCPTKLFASIPGSTDWSPVCTCANQFELLISVPVQRCTVFRGYLGIRRRQALLSSSPNQPKQCVCQYWQTFSQQIYSDYTDKWTSDKVLKVKRKFQHFVISCFASSVDDSVLWQSHLLDEVHPDWQMFLYKNTESFEQFLHWWKLSTSLMHGTFIFNFSKKASWGRPLCVCVARYNTRFFYE